MKALYKTTAIIWTDYDPFGPDCDLHMYDDGIVSLANDTVMGGGAYCSRFEGERVDNPEQDAAWDGTTFFDAEEEEEDGGR